MCVSERWLFVVIIIEIELEVHHARIFLRLPSGHQGGLGLSWRNMILYFWQAIFEEQSRIDILGNPVHLNKKHQSTNRDKISRRSWLGGNLFLVDVGTVARTEISYGEISALHDHLAMLARHPGGADSDMTIVIATNNGARA